MATLESVGSALIADVPLCYDPSVSGRALIVRNYGVLLRATILTWIKTQLQPLAKKTWPTYIICTILNLRVKHFFEIDLQSY